jgi:hypothetical protein
MAREQALAPLPLETTVFFGPDCAAAAFAEDNAAAANIKSLLVICCPLSGLLRKISLSGWVAV